MLLIFCNFVLSKFQVALLVEINRRATPRLYSFAELQITDYQLHTTN